MKKESRKKLSEVFDVIGELCAFLAIAVLAFICVNGVFEFITDQTLTYSSNANFILF